MPENNDLLDYKMAIASYVLNHLKEVLNERGGVIGYKLELDVEQTEKMCAIIENTKPK